MELLELAYTAARARFAALEEWRGGRLSYATADVPPGLDMTNDERSAIELYEWLAEKPDTYFLYIRSGYEGELRVDAATTWTGQPLGNVRFGRAWRDNFGGTRVPVTVYGHNGVHYVGTYFKSAGDYARVRKAARVLCGPRKGAKQ